MSSTDVLVLLSVALAVVVVAVLATALIVIRKRLVSISTGLATLGEALQGVESEHLRPLEGAVTGDQRAVRHRPRGVAGDRAQGSDRGRAETPMTLWWIGDVLLLVVLLPIVVYLLSGVLKAAQSIVPSVRQIADVAAAGSKDLDAAALLLTTQQQVEQTVAGVANYGGSLDVILDDAE